MRRNSRNKKRVNKKERDIKKILYFLIFTLLIISIVCSIIIFNNLRPSKISKNFDNNYTISNDSSADNTSFSNVNTEIGEDKNNEEQPVTFTLTALGDTLCHNTQYWDAYNSETKEYDFSYVYEDIKYYTKVADITVGSLETTFAGEDKGYSNYPTFNSPDSLATALKKIGFDVISLAGNHALDYGYSGICRTIDV